jgi:hypothetical protein
MMGASGVTLGNLIKMAAPAGNSKTKISQARNRKGLTSIIKTVQLEPECLQSYDGLFKILPDFLLSLA